MHPLQELAMTAQDLAAWRVRDIEATKRRYFGDPVSVEEMREDVDFKTTTYGLKPEGK